MPLLWSYLNADETNICHLISIDLFLMLFCRFLKFSQSLTMHAYTFIHLHAYVYINAISSQAYLHICSLYVNIYNNFRQMYESMHEWRQNSNIHKAQNWDKLLFVCELATGHKKKANVASCYCGRR